MNTISGDRTRYEYDSFGNLSSATHNGKETIHKNPDEAGNVYHSTDRSDRRYGKGGKLLKDENWYYHYDVLGNLILKSSFADSEDGFWQKGDWAYSWFATGMLAEVTRPDGKKVQFEYDALGRRIAKIFDGIITRYVWDSNMLLHEWNYKLTERPVFVVSEDGSLNYDREEPVGENLVTWVYDQTNFTPAAKLVDGKQYSIIADYLGTPIEAYDENGKRVWQRQLDCYGKLRKGDNEFIPFLFQGQYWDKETGLAYNRFRYYDAESGVYISKDPIGLEGKNPNAYAYVSNPTRWVDIFGLDPISKTLAEWLKDHPDLLEQARELYRTKPEWQGLSPATQVWSCTILLPAPADQDQT